MFLPLTGSVLLKNRGKFSVHQIAHRDRADADGNVRVYALVGKGYIRLGVDGACSANGYEWEDIRCQEVRKARDGLKHPVYMGGCTCQT